MALVEKVEVYSLNILIVMRKRWEDWSDLNDRVVWRGEEEM